MKIQNYDVFNPHQPVKIRLDTRIKEAFKTVDMILASLDELRPELVSIYISTIKKTLMGIVRNYHVNTSKFPITHLSENLSILKEHFDLQNLILQYVCLELDICEDKNALVMELEVESLSNIRAYERLSYYLAKSFAYILGDDEAIPLWKSIVSKRIELMKIEDEQKRDEPQKTEISFTEDSDKAIARWKDMGLVKFTRAIIDDNKILYRFDKCLTHEALKDLNDPQWAYLCSCYMGDAPEYNTLSNNQLRRTQTLHHGSFCDELYWDKRHHKDVTQPSLDFTKNLGK